MVGEFSRITNSKLEEHVKVDRNSLIYHSSIGRYTYFGENDKIMCSDIGRFCSIAWNVSIGPRHHDYHKVTTHGFLHNDRFDIRPKDEPDESQWLDKKTNLGNDVWIGANAIIANGLTIGDGAVIGGNAMVTKDVPPYAIAVGNPAKILKYRFEDSIIDQLIELKWWNFEIDLIKQNYKLFKSNDIKSFIKKMKE